ncbi:hypothetical protein GMJLKIPL_4433 [Methylobacterium isbiliense]|uniref:Uncharacterized protein n=1 Tax=Methylobacterium isbiliense TaxID=315478 RepID=A0ABQ4SL47_9HYPH|nr:hypothetical protein GMJLKIPL_4433 [Methylobacterium isbiliense]
MSIAAALALQSIPFAALVLAHDARHREYFAVVYPVAVGLLLSGCAMLDRSQGFPLVFGSALDAHLRSTPDLPP